MQASDRAIDFALSPGGPVDRLQQRIGLIRADAPRLVRRALALGLVTWVPLLIMTLLEPRHAVAVSFLQDIGAHARLLIVIPLLVIAEGPIGIRTRMVASQFLLSGLVSEADVPRYEAAWHRGRRLLDSWVAELVVVALTALAVWRIMHGVLQDPATFWFEQPGPNGTTFTMAGWWQALVATPIFLFLLFRWMWRYIVWTWFLRRMSKLDLRLTGTHPDSMGGLGFVPFNHGMFAIITFAVACATSAAAANRILYTDVPLRAYQWPVIGVVLLSVIVGVAPLLVFSRLLIPTKRRGWMKYSSLASDYVWSFEQKWIEKPKQEELLGSGDIQSLADIGGSFQRMIGMRMVAIDRGIVMSFLLAAAIPALPLLLTVMPLKEIVRLLLKAVM